MDNAVACIITGLEALKSVAGSNISDAFTHYIPVLEALSGLPFGVGPVLGAFCMVFKALEKCSKNRLAAGRLEYYAKSVFEKMELGVLSSDSTLEAQQAALARLKEGKLFPDALVNQVHEVRQSSLVVYMKCFMS